MKKTIIVIVGPIASGKDFIAEYIHNKISFPIFPISDILRDIAKEREIEQTRENLIAINLDLEKTYGKMFLIQKLLDKVQENAILTGLRIPAVQFPYLREEARTVIIGVDANPKLRFERATARGKLGEATTFEEFMANETRENSEPNPQRVFDAVSMADHVIVNEGTINELYAKIDIILTKENFI